MSKGPCNTTATYSAFAMASASFLHLPSAEVNVLSARKYRVAGRQHLLMIDAEVPFVSLGAGYPRAKEILAVASAIGWCVTLFPLHRSDFDWDAAPIEIASEIEIIARRGTAGLRDFLSERQGYYDVILVSRPESMELVREVDVITRMCSTVHG